MFRWVQRFTPLLGRRRPALSPQCRRPLVRRRDLCEGRRTVALRLPGDRPVRPDHRRLRLTDGATRRLRAGSSRRCSASHGEPAEVVTDRAWTLVAVVDELLPGAFHNTDQYANNRIEADHGRLKSRLRPMRGLKRDHTARVIVRGHAFMQNLRRGHYELGVEVHRAPARRSRVQRTRRRHLNARRTPLGRCTATPTQRNRARLPLSGVNAVVRQG